MRSQNGCRLDATVWRPEAAGCYSVLPVHSEFAAAGERVITVAIHRRDCHLTLPRGV